MNNQYNKDGKKEGLWVKIYDNGVVQEERNYVNGVREGIYKSYYMNGEIEIIKNYKKHMEGPYKEYHSNEKLFKECSYNKKGKLEGKYKEYDVEGNLLKETTYENGVEI